MSFQIPYFKSSESVVPYYRITLYLKILNFFFSFVIRLHRFDQLLKIVEKSSFWASKSVGTIMDTFSINHEIGEIDVNSKLIILIIILSKRPTRALQLIF